MFSFISRFFTSVSERTQRSLQPYVEKVHAEEESLLELSNDALREASFALKKTVTSEMEPYKSKMEALEKEAITQIMEIPTASIERDNPLFVIN